MITLDQVNNEYPPLEKSPMPCLTPASSRLRNQNQNSLNKNLSRSSLDTVSKSNPMLLKFTEMMSQAVQEPDRIIKMSQISVAGQNIRESLKSFKNSVMEEEMTLDEPTELND